MYNELNSTIHIYKFHIENEIGVKLRIGPLITANCLGTVNFGPQFGVAGTFTS